MLTAEPSQTSHPLGAEFVAYMRISPVIPDRLFDPSAVAVMVSVSDVASPIVVLPLIVILSSRVVFPEESTVMAVLPPESWTIKLPVAAFTVGEVTLENVPAPAVVAPIVTLSRDPPLISTVGKAVCPDESNVWFAVPELDGCVIVSSFIVLAISLASRIQFYRRS